MLANADMSERFIPSETTFASAASLSGTSIDTVVLAAILAALLRHSHAEDPVSLADEENNVVVSSVPQRTTCWTDLVRAVNDPVPAVAENDVASVQVRRKNG